MPFATTSVIAARFFARRNIKADLIYIDGSHDYIDVKMDLLHYTHVVSENGMIFGDDYCWEGVKQAVDEHVSDNNTRLELLDSKWIIR